MKILNLSEGSFPIKFSIKLASVEVPNIGKLQDELSIDAEIQKISKNLYRCAGQLKGSFEDACQNCLKKTGVEVSNRVNVTIKDLTEMYSDSSEQDQTHYQDLEYFDLHRFIEEELAIIYPDIVKCSENCLEGDITHVKEKNLPFKKIRDLIE